ncbi:hypothetical protein HN51_011385 [Arachis hypogaea]|uniref:RING-type domain-containing protein n=2 Tax=Arachis TaxID=3817 RepID=A0A445DZ95_ARAHY|nr:uncharacterized RING finger protein ECU07_0330 [Arachis duranensis]XP_025687882.1 uncharacterized RING finger protein ECU07_0330 [Arachis hypogaea]QHO56679.1 E3 ubiquitin-protein ligase [Arachis hypogaea]RYR68538.1 hypothetical protein Ahy_A03g015036 [Arachis hypogaea]
MSNNYFMPLPGSRRTSSDTRAFNVYTFDNTDSNDVPVYYRSRSNHNTGNRNSGVIDPRRVWESRSPSSGRHTAPNFEAQPNNRQQFHFNNGEIGRGSNPRFRDIFRQSPPRTATTREIPPQVENSESMALSKLKKEVYNPVPKRLARRLSLYYRGDNNNGSNGVREREKDKDEEGKSCAVCLEDFEAKEEVMVTPCNHMFHEECIVPWVTSKGQCPVCRFVIIERVRGNLYPSSFNSSNIANMEPSELIAGELLSILSAMEEAFQLGNGMY